MFRPSSTRLGALRGSKPCPRAPRRCACSLRLVVPTIFHERTFRSPVVGGDSRGDDRRREGEYRRNKRDHLRVHGLASEMLPRTGLAIGREIWEVSGKPLD